MTHRRMQSALAIIWILGLVIVIAMTGNLRSIFDFLLLVVFAVGPPAAMWLWWTDPGARSSQRVQTVHGNVNRAERRS
jgi:hypothetical protein